MRLVVPGTISEALAAWLTSHPARHERGAIVFCRKFSDCNDELETSHRYVIVDWRALDASEVLASSPTRLEYSTRKFPADFFRCDNEELIFGFAHSHPLGGLEFSEQDSINEGVLLRALRNYSSSGQAELFAMLRADGQWRGRVRSTENTAIAQDCQHVLVHTHRILAHHQTSNALGGWNSRQAAAFGKPFNDLLGDLRVTCVGLGGTGSPLAHIAARAGIGQMVLIDGDDVEETNLNRTTGYGVSDVGSKKAVVTKRLIEEIGLGTCVQSIPEYLHKSGSGIDALSTSDIIFGCTDDVLGRDILNQAALYYCVPYIDVGLSGRVEDPTGSNPYLAEHRARISTIMPESGACLRCQRVVTDSKIRYQQELARRPDLAELDAETLKREFYLTGGGEAAPGVGPFTTAAAQFAFMTLMDLLRPYRRYTEELMNDNLWIDFINMRMYSNDYSGQTDCFVCGADGLLNYPENGYRLGMPALGRR